MSSHCCQIFAIPSSTREHMHLVAPTHPSRTTTATTHTSAHATTRFTRERDRMMLLDRNFHHHQLVRFSHSHTHTNTHTLARQTMLYGTKYAALETRGSICIFTTRYQFSSPSLYPTEALLSHAIFARIRVEKKKFPLPFPPSLLFRFLLTSHENSPSRNGNGLLAGCGKDDPSKFVVYFSGPRYCCCCVCWCRCWQRCHHRIVARFGFSYR